MFLLGTVLQVLVFQTSDLYFIANMQKGLHFQFVGLQNVLFLISIFAEICHFRSRQKFPHLLFQLENEICNFWLEIFISVKKQNNKNYAVTIFRKQHGSWTPLRKMNKKNWKKKMALKLFCTRRTRKTLTENAVQTPLRKKDEKGLNDTLPI